MGNTYLVVQAESFRHVRNTTLFIHRTLQSNFGDQAELIICDEIDAAAYADGSLVFVIGENFARHTRQPGCRYIYLNFSIVVMLGNPLKTGRQGWKAIRRKKGMMLDKLDLYDALFDYFPPQTSILQRRLSLPVRGFQIAVHPDDLPDARPLQKRDYDVCFVGGITERRRDVIDKLQARGVSLSPQRDVVFEEVATQSRCCLNLHAQRSNHLETPRIIGAIAASCPVVSEKSYGLETLIPDDLLVTASLSQLADQVEALLNNPSRLQSLCDQSGIWYRDTYLPGCENSWRMLCSEFAAEGVTAAS